MNKGKQWKWSKKIRKELEKLKKPPLKINIIKAVTKEKPRPKRLKGICLNWPGKEEEDVHEERV